MHRASRLLVGLLLGAVTAPVGLVVAVCARPFARRFAELDRRRVKRFLDVDSAEPTRARAARYLVARAGVGLLGGMLLALLGYGVVMGVIAVQRLLAHRFDGVDLAEDVVAVLWTALLGGVLLYLEVQGLRGVAALEGRVAARYLGPSEAELLRGRIVELAESRAGIVAAVDAERRRIERDLHDGVQQRLVALGVLLGRARRHPDHADELLRQAHEESRGVLDDLREVAWRVYPAALDSLGLAEALEAVADRSPIPVTITCEPTRAPAAVETAVYFVVSEAVTNAAKHSGASMVRVDIGREGDVVRVRVEDDGVGGADPAGGGLAGLSRRVLALDGRFAVTSPAGGPTVIAAEVPCG
ncbi:sensor histidine kinase [Saccharothrix obliqua]|uniref:sensor histidine kinase n=1 Tax=Saccharothrix obliqua TaxID=2861747 RepID=UPI001C5E97A6|nr:sensor histidine kinase [Saccharothrix obliqua]MBW4720674.1 sensor histidine kinase [Saccharothrix obliqua]